MKPLLLISLLALSALRDVVGSQLSVIQASNLNLTRRLFASLAEQEKSDNFVFSPYGVQTLLNLVYLGASGNTSANIGKWLYETSTSGDIQTDFEEVLWPKQKSDRLQYKLASHLYVLPTVNIAPRFSNVAEKTFRAGTSAFDPSNLKTINTINRWVIRNTRNKIGRAFDRGDLETGTRVAPVNAIFFQALWAKSFAIVEPASEAERKLIKERNLPRVMGAVLNARHRVVEEIGAELIQVPLADSSSSVIFIRPLSKSPDALRNVEDKLKSTDLEDLLDELYDTPTKQLDIRFPKLKVKTSVDVDTLLADSGMLFAFQDGAGFSDVVNEARLKMSLAEQTTTIEFQEGGVIGAAATLMNLADVCAGPTEQTDYREVKQYQPFLFLLVTHGGKIATLMGRYAATKAE